MDVVRFTRIQTPWLGWDLARLKRNLGIYIHIPFCLHRCPYCDYLTFGEERPAPFTPAQYSELLLREIALRGAGLQQALAGSGREVDTVYIGGGTPTYLAPELLCGIVQAVREVFPLAAAGLELTVEANPECLNSEYVGQLANAGVNRLSVGVQAAYDRHLSFLGRAHRWSDVERALAATRNGSISNLSLDLIYALPGMTVSEARSSVRRLLEFDPAQLACYELTVEPCTQLAGWAARHPQRLATPEQSAAQQRAIERELSCAGYCRYEVCSYARPGSECRHNLRYWTGGDYLGLGLGAASRIGEQVSNNPRSFKAYSELLDELAAPAESFRRFVLNGEPPAADGFMQLRTRRGLSGNHPGLKREWVASGWLKSRHGGWEVTRRGLNFVDLMALEILPDQNGT